MTKESISKSSTSEKEKDLRQRQTKLWGRPALEEPQKSKKPHEKSDLPIFRISATAVRDYLKCQKLFYYKWVLKMRLPTKAIQLVFGGAFHSGIEALYDDKDPVEVFKKLFKITEIDKPKEMSQEDFEKKFQENYEDGIEMMKEWKEKAKSIHRQYDIPWKGKSEVYFESWWVHPETGVRLPILVNGKVDRVVETSDIIEFKTSGKKWVNGLDTDEKDRDKNVDLTIQGDIYSFARYIDRKLKNPKIFEGKSQRFIYIIFLKGRKKDRIQVLETTRTVNDYMRAFETIELIVDAVRTKAEKDYKYGEGFMHKYCDCRKYEEQLLI